MQIKSDKRNEWAILTAVQLTKSILSRFKLFHIFIFFMVSHYFIKTLQILFYENYIIICTEHLLKICMSVCREYQE